MEKRRSRLVDRWWLLLLAITVFVVAFQIGGASAAAPAGKFPAFIPMSGVTPSGVAVDKVGNVYVSIREVRADGQHGLIWKFRPSGRGPSLFADIGIGEIYGLAVTANGDLYAAMGRVGSVKGVYRVLRKGHIRLLPGSDQIIWATAFAFDARGTLYVTESHSGTPPAYGPGAIWRIPRGGQAELWLQHGLLTGINILGYPIGANGIAYYHGNLYVTNTDKGLVMRIPVQKDGSAGAPEVWAMLQEVPESPLARSRFPLMGDDLRLDVHGNVYVAVLTRAAVVRINALDKSQETIAAFLIADGSLLYAPLDFPASLAFGTGKRERTNLFVTNLGMGKVFAPQLLWPGPGLVKIDAGMPGQPLH
jgi:sugar lactone lactonase YvrE